MKTFEMNGETFRIIATSKNLIDIQLIKSLCGDYGEIGISRDGFYVWYESLVDYDLRQSKKVIRIWDYVDRKEQP